MVTGIRGGNASARGFEWGSHYRMIMQTDDE